MKSVRKDFLFVHEVNTLAVVESQAKTKTIQAYLGEIYRVKASVGHARDLRATKEESKEFTVLMLSAAPSNPVRHVVSTMQQADPRLLRLVRALAFAFIFISLVVAVMGCSPKLHIANEGLDQATLMLFTLLPVLYFSGKQNQSSPHL